MDKDYLKLFENMEDKNNKDEFKMIKETPDFQNYNNAPSLNETPDVSKFNINQNLNDGWGVNFDVQFETRINGEVQRSNNIYEQRRSRRRNNVNEDLNGLNKYLEEDNLNEVIRHNQQTQQNKRLDLSGDVVTLEMFNEMRRQAMDSVYRQINS